MADESYYVPGSGLPKDDMRLLSGDVVEPYVLTDAEIGALYSADLGRLSSAALVLDAMAARVAGLYDTSSEGQTFRESQRAEGYRKQANQYRASAKLAGEKGAFPPGAEAGATSAGGGALLVSDAEGCGEFAGRRLMGWYGADPLRVGSAEPGIPRPGAMDFLYR